MPTHRKKVSLALALNTSEWVQTPPGAARKRFDSHDFGGYGSYNNQRTPTKEEMLEIDEKLSHKENGHVLLNELEATAISGNDILSSTFYVSGLVTLSAGKLAPLCLLLVGMVLYLFRGIYHETVMALPCNGGTYNILLNCTSKQVASMAAVFAIIAYITTGVVSALEAIAYLQTVIPNNLLDTQAGTIGLLAFFCVLTNLGMQESAFVAKSIFVMHVGVLAVLSTFGVVFLCFNYHLLFQNWESDYPPVDAAGEIIPGTFWTAIFYGFSSAMLGVSGFETSSQFVEEQAPGVFPKTLRNMWAGVFLFNPLLSLISFAALDVEEIYTHKDTVLAKTAHVIGHWVQTQLHFPDHFIIGPILSTVVSLDAFVVLAAALLTGYVGINGLIRRMSMDRCLPQIFLIQNPWTGTDSFILVGFFLLCVSQVIILDSNVEALGGVYCYAFLTVMTIFAFGNILLKVKRPGLPREVNTSWWESILGLVAVVLALLGNVLGKPELLTYFLVYFLIVGALVLIMFQRVSIMRLMYKLLKPRDKKLRTGETDESSTDSETNEQHPLLEHPLLDPEDPSQPRREHKEPSCLSAISTALKGVQDVPFVFYCKHDDLHMLNKAMLYIQQNEQTNRIIVVHCTHTESNVDSSLTEHVKLIDVLYPKVKVSLLTVIGDFNAATVEWVSQSLDVPINAMFISCPDKNFAMKVSQLRGMRIITAIE